MTKDEWKKELKELDEEMRRPLPSDSWTPEGIKHFTHVVFECTLAGLFGTVIVAATLFCAVLVLAGIYRLGELLVQLLS